MDQEQAGAEAIPRAGPSKGADGNAVGLPHIQPAALDSPKQVPRNTSGHLREQDNTEENRVTRSTQQIGVPRNLHLTRNPVLNARFLHSIVTQRT